MGKKFIFNRIKNIKYKDRILMGNVCDLDWERWGQEFRVFY